MPRRIVLDSAFLSRVKKEDAAYVSTLNTMTLKKIPCKYCKCLTITKYEDLTGHFIAFCPRCGQTATYNQTVVNDIKQTQICAILSIYNESVLWYN